jgi:hypothetical protein
MQDERRKYPRFDVTANIKVKKLKGETTSQDAFVKNISAEGFCFSSQTPYNTGDKIEVEIVEDKAREMPMFIKGEVIWCSKNKDASPGPQQNSYITGVKVMGIRKTDEARFAMLYCERMLSELKSFLHL